MTKPGQWTSSVQAVNANRVPMSEPTLACRLRRWAVPSARTLAPNVSNHAARLSGNFMPTTISE